MTTAVNARRPVQYPYCYSSRGTVFYTPRNPADRRARRAAAALDPSLPTPHIGPRQRRPHSIHIVSYPSGYIPHDLRAKPVSGDAERQRRRDKERRKRKHDQDKKRKEQSQKKLPGWQDKARQTCPKPWDHDKTRSLAPFSGDHRIGRVGSLFSKLKSAFHSYQGPRPASLDSRSPTPIPRLQARTRVRPISWLSAASRLSRLEDLALVHEPSASPEHLPPRPTPIPSIQGHARRLTTASYVPSPVLEYPARSASPSSHPPALIESTSQLPNPAFSAVTPAPISTPPSSDMVDVDRPAPALSAPGGGIVAGHPNRNSFMSNRSAKSAMTSLVQEIQPPKPVASGSGLSCTILLAESNVFLTGFDHDGHTRHESHNSTALLRGKLQLNVSKPTKVKSVTLKLLGKARTEWPEGIPPLKVDLFEEAPLRTQALTFFHAMHHGWETEYGNQCTFSLKGNSLTSTLSRPPAGPADSVASLQLGGRHRSNMSTKELKRLSLRSAESRSFGKGDSPVLHQVQARGFKVFHPGTYEYSFELPIDHHQLETIKLQHGSVKWELETIVERAGAFKPNLHGTKEVSIVRLPDQLSLETSEPISICRQWEDQLFYDIMISGKSFPIGAKIPIAFKLTPLAKVQVHKLKVFVTESIEYWTNDRKVTRKDSGRKILLLEKTAGKPLDKQFELSDLQILSGGELSAPERQVARDAAQRRRVMQAQLSHATPQPLPDPTENILGDLDLGLEAFWGSTEMEMNVQIPTCEMMAKDKSLRLHPDCSWKNVNVHHWIKIVMRISRLDPEDAAGKRRRHFEISIDSPFTVLNCRATQANTALPEYNNPEGSDRLRFQASCGCPDAQILSSSMPTDDAGGHLFEGSRLSAALPLPPQAVYIHTSTQGIIGNPNLVSTATATGGGARGATRSVAASTVQRLRDQECNARPIHLLRYPSFDPPPFDADQAPPPMPTPPPNYDLVVGTPSVDGMADYFHRLSRYDEPEQTLATEDYFASGANGSGDGSWNDSTPPAHSNSRHVVNEHGEDTEMASDDSDSADEDGPARTVSRTGTVYVANPRTPGGRMGPSRSFEIERPATAGFTH